MKKIIYTSLLGVSLCLINLSVNAQILDNTFDGDGIVATDFPNSYDEARSLVIQSDGKIILGGESGATTTTFTLVRYNTDGSLDNTFGTSGKVTTAFGTKLDICESIALQKDGKIVAVGITSNGVSYDIALARYNTDGSLDNTFDTDGKLIIAVSATYNDEVNVAIQSDGKILVTGATYALNNNANIVVLRYNSDGSLDNTFGTGGKLIVDLGTNYDYAYDIAIQTDDKIVILGTPNRGIALLRYNSDGTLDNTFDSDGMVTAYVGSTTKGKALKIQSDGKILVAGNGDNGSIYMYVLLRYNSDGSLEKDVVANFGVSTSASAMALQSDGKIVLAGDAAAGSMNTNFAVARFNSDCSIDKSFGTNGIVTIDVSGSVGNSFDGAYGVGIQSDGKIVLGGYKYNSTNSDIALLRYTDISTNIESSEQSSENIEIYPNPSSSQINVSLNKELSNASVRLLSLTGEALINHENVSGSNFRFDISAVENGLYILEIIEGEKISRIKVVKN